MTKVVNETKYIELINRYYELYIKLNNKIQNFYTYIFLFKDNYPQPINEKLTEILELYNEYYNCTNKIDLLEDNISGKTIKATIYYVANNNYASSLVHPELYSDYNNPVGWRFIETYNIKSKLCLLADLLGLYEDSLDEQERIVKCLNENSNDLFATPIYSYEKDMQYHIYKRNSDFAIINNFDLRKVHNDTINKVNILAKKDLDLNVSEQEQNICEYILYKIYPFMIDTDDENKRIFLTNYSNERFKMISDKLGKELVERIDIVIDEYLKQELENGNIFYQNKNGHAILCVPENLSEKVRKQIDDNNKYIKDERETKAKRA